MNAGSLCPSGAAVDVADRGAANAVLRSYGRLRVAGGAEQANGGDVLVGQLRVQPTPGVLGNGDHFKVVRIHAFADSAEVVEVQAVRYGPTFAFVDPPVRTTRGLPVLVRLPVAIWQTSELPDPAGRCKSSVFRLPPGSSDLSATVVVSREETNRATSGVSVELVRRPCERRTPTASTLAETFGDHTDQSARRVGHEGVPA